MSSQTICHLLGNIAITFASIEHRLVDLLGYLLTEDKCLLVQPYVLDDLPLSHLIQKIRAVAELRLCDHKQVFHQLKGVLNDIDGLRVQRNLFIHGDWFTEDLTDYATSVTVLDYRRPRLDKKSGLWKYMETVRVTPTKLGSLLDKVNAALNKLTSVNAEIYKVKLR